MVAHVLDHFAKDVAVDSPKGTVAHGPDGSGAWSVVEERPLSEVIGLLENFLDIAVDDDLALAAF